MKLRIHHFEPLLGLLYAEDEDKKWYVAGSDDPGYTETVENFREGDEIECDVTDRGDITRIHVQHPLSARDMELLGILQEECAEVIQIISKIRRFGHDSTNPYIENSKTNMRLLIDELGDIQCIVNMLQDRGVLRQQDIDDRAILKEEKVIRNLRTPD